MAVCAAAQGVQPGQEQDTAIARDTTTLLHAFRAGRLHGHLRYLFIATDNKRGLTDYHANAIGGGIKYETAPFKGFRAGIGGFFVYNIGSSDLSKADPATGQKSRYELPLFDVEDPHNRHDMDRLEELYLTYRRKHSRITFGKQLINTPFINLQDSRMRPTAVSGLMADISGIRNMRLEIGYLYALSPRGTVRWYGTGKSIGLYAQGVNADGKASGYKGNLRSRGIGIAGVTHRFRQDITVKLSDVFVENIFNTLLVQIDYARPSSSKGKFVAGLQYIRQDAVNHGGNEDPAKSYFAKGSHSQSFGARAGWEQARWNATLNYTRITAQGRYLLPREWGMEPFFSSLQRERNEGAGDVHAVALKGGCSWPRAKTTVQAGLGYYGMPDVTHFALNKYGLPAYAQFNAGVKYAPAGTMKGLELEMLFVYKGRAGNVYGNDRYVINRVDMSTWSFLVNYRF